MIVIEITRASRGPPAGLQGHRLPSPRSRRGWPSATRWTRSQRHHGRDPGQLRAEPRLRVVKARGSPSRSSPAPTRPHHHMKSVGEAMAIGRSSLKPSRRPSDRSSRPDPPSHGSKGRRVSAAQRRRRGRARHAGRTPTDAGCRSVSRLCGGAHLEELYEATGIDRCSRPDRRDHESHDIKSSADALTKEKLLNAKRHGFSDEQIGGQRSFSGGRPRGAARPWLRPVPHGGHLRRGVPRGPPYSTRPMTRRPSPARPAAQGDHPGQRAQPDRAGRRVRYSCVHASSPARRRLRDVMVQQNPETV